MNIDTISLIVIILLMGFLKYFIGFKFLVHVIFSMFIIIIKTPNPFIVSISDFHFVELIINGLIYTILSYVLIKMTME